MRATVGRVGGAELLKMFPKRGWVAAGVVPRVVCEGVGVSEMENPAEPGRFPDKFDVLPVDLRCFVVRPVVEGGKGREGERDGECAEKGYLTAEDFFGGEGGGGWGGVGGGRSRGVGGEDVRFQIPCIGSPITRGSQKFPEACAFSQLVQEKQSRLRYSEFFRGG